jgi:DNA-binding transcriptional LysR family regulator
MKSVFDSWSDLRVFLAVMRAGSTLAASKQLRQSQPTVARRIDVLEHVTGLTLFERSTQGLRPTEHAMALLPRAEAVEAAIEAFEAAVDGRSTSTTSTIRITAIGIAFSPRLAAILDEFNEAYPDVRFEFVPSDRILDLCAGEADIAIRHVLTVDDPRLVARQISVTRTTLYCSQRYAAKHGTPKGPGDFANHSFLLYEQGAGARRFNEWLRAQIAPHQVAGTLSDIPSMIVAVRSGLGMGALPVAMAVDAPELVQCFDPPEVGLASTWLVIGPDAHKRREVRAFADFLAPRYSAQIGNR